MVPVDCCSSHCVFPNTEVVTCLTPMLCCCFSYTQITLCIYGTCVSVCSPWCIAHVRVAHWERDFDGHKWNTDPASVSCQRSFAPSLCVCTQAWGEWVRVELALGSSPGKGQLATAVPWARASHLSGDIPIVKTKDLFKTNSLCSDLSVYTLSLLYSWFQIRSIFWIMFINLYHSSIWWLWL